MGGEAPGLGDWPPAPPTAAPMYIPRGDHTWTHFDNSVNAVSFGFVATAILISMFLVMAIFEKILRATSPPSGSGGGSILSEAEAGSRGGGFNLKLSYPSPKISGNAKEVSVVMPGDNIPTYIAHPAPVPCPPERILWPLHHQQLPNLCSPSCSN